MRAVEADQGLSAGAEAKRIPCGPHARKSGSAPLEKPLQAIAAHRDAIQAKCEDHTAIAIGTFAVICTGHCLSLRQTFSVASLAADLRPFINVHGINSY